MLMTYYAVHPRKNGNNHGIMWIGHELFQSKHHQLEIYIWTAFIFTEIMCSESRFAKKYKDINELMPLLVNKSGLDLLICPMNNFGADLTEKDCTTSIL